MKKIPRLLFAHLPTIIEPLPQISARLGLEIRVKRDDQTGLAFGGNKTRKLEFLVAEAQAQGARTLITAGALQSNHCRQTVAAARKFGFHCALVLEGSAPKTITGNLLLDQLMGAEIHWAKPGTRDQLLQEIFQESWNAGKRPYLIPYGGSNPIGAAAYVYAFMEMSDQLNKTTLPDNIVFASSSGGTQAGLVLGAKIMGYSGKILGISVDENGEVLRKRVAKLANDTAELLGVEVDVDEEDILVNDSYLGDGYGVLGEPEREAILLFAENEGLLLDPVYTGRAAAGLLDLIRKGDIRRTETVLFWHTGGTPALFAERYLSVVK